MKRHVKIRGLILFFGAGSLGTVFYLLLLASPWGQALELYTADLWFNLRGAIRPPKDIVIIAMDEASYTGLDVPMDRAWPRSLHAQLLNRLVQLGARRAVFDILFLGPSADPLADEELASSIAKIPTVLGADTGVREQGSGASRFEMEELLEPYDKFQNAAEATALVKMPERFGFVREFGVPRSYLTHGLPTLYEAALGAKHEDPDLPSDRDLVWYYGPAGTITTYPYYQVVDPQSSLPTDALKDKIVFIGLNLRTGIGPTQKDTFKVPFQDRSMFGIEIQATASANILEHQWLRRTSNLGELFGLLALSFFVVGMVATLPPLGAALACIGWIVCWSGGSYLGFLHGLFIPGLGLTLIISPIAMLGNALTYYLIAYKSKQRVERAFKLYLPPQMARRMRSDPKSLEPGGSDVIATALFTDIEGFTEIVEKMPGQQVSAMLNSYFTEIVDVIFDCNGTVIKFIGDAVFAVFGAPILIDNPELQACKAALGMQAAIHAFNQRAQFPLLRTRIGIHTGPMVVGNLGSRRRFDFTAVGDAVNLAARLEGLNRYFGTRVIISESVEQKLTSEIVRYPIGKVRVAGRAEAIPVTTILNKPLEPQIAEKFNLAMEAMHKKELDAAIALFGQLAPIDSDIAGVALYLGTLLQTVNRSNWDGTISFLSK